LATTKPLGYLSAAGPLEVELGRRSIGIIALFQEGGLHSSLPYDIYVQNLNPTVLVFLWLAGSPRAKPAD
jgi:hypothetical protein